MQEEILQRFLEWKEQQPKTNRGGEVMYDVIGHHKYIYEHELFEYWNTTLNNK